MKSYFDQILFKYQIQKIKYFHNYFNKATVEWGFKTMSKFFVFFSYNSKNVLNVKIQISIMYQSAKSVSLCQISSVGVVRIDKIAHVGIPVTSIQVIDTQYAVEIDVRHSIFYYQHLYCKIKFKVLNMFCFLSNFILSTVNFCSDVLHLP